MTARNSFCHTLFMSSFQGKSRFYEIFSGQISLVVLLDEGKKCLPISICGAEEKIV